ncbi:hypothetical protein [Paracoccus sp. (in: a-proteobacteria)]|uniref:hypothetical protein n=1 Tax=Paracoccus sp. TaxID=267 RepID=UPI00396D02FF
MIRNAWLSRAALLGVCGMTMGGCASSPNRMPPTGAASMTAAAPYAPAPYAPAPYAPAPYAPAPPVYAPVPAPVAPLPEALPPPVQTTGITGLEERKPDLCGARKHDSAKGQPGSVIPTLGLSKAYRVVEYRGIEPQDYDPNRLVFRLDQAGTITNIDCG